MGTLYQPSYDENVDRLVWNIGDIMSDKRKTCLNNT
jgi:hypothetical protein